MNRAETRYTVANINSHLSLDHASSLTNNAKRVELQLHRCVNYSTTRSLHKLQEASITIEINYSLDNDVLTRVTSERHLLSHLIKN